MLHRCGVNYACISPGNRNSPLTIAFIEHPGIKCFSQIDERSGGFMALGLAKITQQPVALVCTSGTAAANYFPAVIEANYSCVPLIVITADRPRYLVGTGVNQTIDQQNLYGKQVRFFRDVGLPDENYLELEKNISSALRKSIGLNSDRNCVYPPGPVHLNFPFEDPLFPENLLSTISRIRKNYEFKAHKFYESNSEIDFEIIPKSSNRYNNVIADIPDLTAKSKVLIIVGRTENTDSHIQLLQFADKLGAPIFADPTSQIRYGKLQHNVISNYDHFLRSIRIQPDIVLRFGAKPTSKILCQMLDKWKAKTILIDPCGRFNDDCPTIIQAAANQFCEDQMKQISTNNNFEWLGSIQKFEQISQNIINEVLIEKQFVESSIAKTCCDSLSDETNLMIGNSRIIRDIDLFTTNIGTNIRVFVNRGVSGIDGIVSTALGISAANYGHKSNTRNILLIGDLSFYHDMNGLLVAKRYALNLTIVVVNNNGGGIFSQLPISNYDPQNFQEFWRTVHNLDFKKVADLYDCRYFNPENLNDFKLDIQKTQNLEGVTIIEVKPNIDESLIIQNQIERMIAAKLQNL